jgi:hypothetical protein
LSLRHAPRLEFHFDKSIERAAELTQLIDQAVRADRGESDEDHESKRNPPTR